MQKRVVAAAGAFAKTGVAECAGGPWVGPYLLSVRWALVVELINLPPALAAATGTRATGGEITAAWKPPPTAPTAPAMPPPRGRVCLLTFPLPRFIPAVTSSMCSLLGAGDRGRQWVNPGGQAR